MTLESREKKLRLRIEENNFVLCDNMVNELINIKLQKAYNLHLSLKDRDAKLSRLNIELDTETR